MLQAFDIFIHLDFHILLHTLMKSKHILEMDDDTKHLEGEGKLKLYFNCSESGQSDILSLSLQRNFSNEHRAIGHVLGNIYVNIWRSTLVGGYSKIH